MNIYFQYDCNGRRVPMDRVQAKAQCDRLRKLINSGQRQVKTPHVETIVSIYHKNAANGAVVSHAKFHIQNREN